MEPKNLQAKTIIEALRKDRVLLVLENGELKVRGPKSKVTPEVLVQIRENKPALIQYLETEAAEDQVDFDGIFNKSGEAGLISGHKALDFGLFYFGNATAMSEGYRLLMEGARYADQNDFTAVWVPERHFHEFGGLYPSPSVLGSAVAATTERIQIRAGSVVVPLHNPLRIAEEWAVIDVLSKGRVGIACASGWQANDFVLMPDVWPERHKVLYENIEKVKRLWKGEAIELKDGNDFLKDTRIYPKPVQPELPLWLTSGGNIETFRSAGRLGMKLLTHLLGSTVEELAPKIKAYREEYAAHNLPDGGDRVVVMLHTYMDETEAKTQAKAKKPFIEYLKTSVDLLKKLAESKGMGSDLSGLNEGDMEIMYEYAYNRYTSSASLVGTVENRISLLQQLSAIGVDEIACLIDFGVDSDSVIANLKNISRLKDAYHAQLQQASTSLAEA